MTTTTRTLYCREYESFGLTCVAASDWTTWLTGLARLIRAWLGITATAARDRNREKHAHSSTKDEASHSDHFSNQHATQKPRQSCVLLLFIRASACAIAHA